MLHLHFVQRCIMLQICVLQNRQSNNELVASAAIYLTINVLCYEPFAVITFPSVTIASLYYNLVSCNIFSTLFYTTNIFGLEGGRIVIFCMWVDLALRCLNFFRETITSLSGYDVIAFLRKNSIFI